MNEYQVILIHKHHELTSFFIILAVFDDLHTGMMEISLPAAMVVAGL